MAENTDNELQALKDELAQYKSKLSLMEAALAEQQKAIRSLSEVSVDGSTDSAIHGEYLIKLGQKIYSRAIFKPMYFTYTDNEIELHKQFNNFPIYDIRNDIVYEAGLTDLESIPRENGMKLQEYQNTFIFDKVTSTLYYNDAGHLTHLITDAVASRQVKLEPYGSFRVPIANPLKRDVRILVKDNTKEKQGPLFVAAEGLCTVSYDSEGFEVFNETEDYLDVMLNYKAEIGAETIDFKDRATAYVKENNLNNN